MITNVVPLPLRLLIPRSRDLGVGNYFRSSLLSTRDIKYIGTNISRLNNKQQELFAYKIVEQFGNTYIERMVFTREPWDLKNRQICLTNLLARIYSPFMVETIIPLSVFNTLESVSFNPINPHATTNIVNNVVTSNSLNATIMKNIIHELNEQNPMLGDYVYDYMKPKLTKLDRYVNLTSRFVERPDEHLSMINEPSALVFNILSEIENAWYATVRHNESTNLIDDTIDTYFDDSDFTNSSFFRSPITNILHNGACFSSELFKQFGQINTAFNKVQFNYPINDIDDVVNNTLEWDLLPYSAEVAYFMDYVTTLNATDFCLEFNSPVIERAVHGVPLMEWSCDKVNIMNRYYPHNVVSDDITWKMEFAGSHLLAWLRTLPIVKHSNFAKVKVIKTYGEELFVIYTTTSNKSYVHYFNMVEAYLCNRDILHTPICKTSTI